MQAVELCRQQDFDLIIMDVMMPRSGRLLRVPGNSQDQRRADLDAQRPGRV